MSNNWVKTAVCLYEHIRQSTINEGIWLCTPGPDRKMLGWALPPGGSKCAFEVLVDGKPVAWRPRELDQEMRDLFDRFLVPKADRLVFSFSLDLSTRHELTCSFGRRLGRRFNSFTWPGDLDAIDIKASNMLRVTRSSNFGYFLLMGYTQHLHIRRLAEKWLAPRVKPIVALDWGCGAGRLLRHFLGDSNFEFSGYDIDPVNIEWCRKNLSGAKIELIRSIGKTPSPDANFDLIYGISIFTHLGTASERFWLAELKRISKPGAVLVMSVHGELAFFKTINDVVQYEQLLDQGLLDVGHCPDLEFDQPSKIADLYRNVFHTLPYILSIWSEYFKIVDYIPGGSTAHQDYVVMIRE